MYPCLKVDAIKERLDLVENFVENSEVRQIMYEDHLRKMPDFQRLSTRFQSKKASLQVKDLIFRCFGLIINILNIILKDLTKNSTELPNLIFKHGHFEHTPTPFPIAFDFQMIIVLPLPHPSPTISLIMSQPNIDILGYV